MKTRAITGFFFVIVMIGSMLLGRTVFDLFFLLLPLLSLWEFYGLIKQNTAKPNIVLGLFLALLGYGFFAFVGYNVVSNLHLIGLTIILAPLVVAAIFITELYHVSESPFNNIAYTFLGVLYVMLPYIFFHGLAYTGGDFNFHLPLGFLVILWSNDTGAYLSGYFFGKTKFFERHSPKKTWEGFIGGVLIAGVAGFVLSLFYHDLTWQHWVSVAILIGLFGTLGDLVESMFKRSINVKDSGGILPGHGGLLDRFDGLLLSAPIVFAYLYLITIF